MSELYQQNLSPEEQSHFTGIAAGSSFMSKVIFAFGMALMISAAGAYVGFNNFSQFFVENPATIWICLAVELILVFTSRLWSTKHPINYLLFALFAFVTGVTIAPLLMSVIMEFGGPGIIYKALLSTTLAFTAIAAIGLTTHRDFSGLRGFLWIALTGMIIVSIVGIFIPWSNNFEMIFSGFGIVVFAGFTMYDIQRLKTYPPDRYIDAALQLYLDIFNLFIYILRLLSSRSRN
ncbi:MAG: Bax inhibitor-1/YccA family protein [Candidatus Gracilibacteria bacterium]|jgi:FtsH-binding integral membrane protein